MHFCSCPVYCKMFCSNRGLRSQDASSTLELGQLFVVSRHCQMSLKGQIAPSWEQTTLETLLPTKPFHPSPPYFSFRSHHHQVSRWTTHTTHLHFLTLQSALNQASDATLPIIEHRVHSGDQRDLLAAKSSKWPFLSCSVFCNFWRYGFILWYPSCVLFWVSSYLPVSFRSPFSFTF